ncbi:hypothetical protein V1289_008522 [Bradyrhizobium sp. AZCC 2289]
MTAQQRFDVLFPLFVLGWGQRQFGFQAAVKCETFGARPDQ